jgi:hypothetical protein
MSTTMSINGQVIDTKPGSLSADVRRDILRLARDAAAAAEERTALREMKYASQDGG